jgi:uncharacterized protein
MRVVVDTNTVVSGFLWGGKPGRLLDLAREGYIRAFTTVELIEELRDVLSRPKAARSILAKGATPEILLAKWKEMTELVSAPAGISVVQADPDDDHVLACAVAALADLIISGDKHLLDIKQYGNARIVNAVEALATFGRESG